VCSGSLRRAARHPRGKPVAGGGSVACAWPPRERHFQPAARSPASTWSRRLVTARRVFSDSLLPIGAPLYR